MPAEGKSLSSLVLCLRGASTSRLGFDGKQNVKSLLPVITSILSRTKLP